MRSMWSALIFPLLKRSDYSLPLNLTGCPAMARRCRNVVLQQVGSLYEAPRVKRLFVDQHFFFFPSVSRG